MRSSVVYLLASRSGAGQVKFQFACSCGSDLAGSLTEAFRAIKCTQKC